MAFAPSLGCPDAPIVGADASILDAGHDAQVAPDTGSPEVTKADTGPSPDTFEIVEEKPGLGIDYDLFEAGIEARYEPDSGDWTSTGWPSDRYRKADGHIDLSNFPNPDSELLGTYLTYGEEVLNGFGLNSAIYFQFDGFLDPDSLPLALETMETLGLVQLVNVSAESGRYGERLPLHFKLYDYGVDLYYLPGTLAMRPEYGLPLEEGATYCAIVTRGIKDDSGHYLSQNEAFSAALESEASLKPLVDWLPGAELRREDIAVATCFTTQQTTDELRQVGAGLDELDVPSVDFMAEPVVYGEFHGTYIAPNFQAGEKPYDVEGELQFETDGTPIVQSEEEVRFMLLVPREGDMPDAGWPIVLYAHGTGGDYESCRGIAADMDELGLAMLCIDQPLHGSRGDDYTDTELVNYSFNFVNPRSGRSGFRQSAIDTMILARMVVAGRFDLEADATQSGLPVTLDGDKVAFFGHSHGGLSGSLVLGVESRVHAAVLSGASGILVETILRRKDPFDVSALVQALLGVLGDDLDTFHPTMTIIQTLVDATDPINYAPYWLQPKDGGAPKHVFVTEGTWDHASPGVGTDALASAAGIPQLLNLAKLSPGHVFQGLEPQEPSVQLNATAGAVPVTAGLKQWQEANHWAAFNRSEARAMWREFLSTFAYGEAPILGPGSAGLTSNSQAVPGEKCGEGDFLDPEDLPLIVRSSTSLFADDFAAGSCVEEPELGAGERDVSYRFTPATSGKYRFSLSYPVPEDEDVDPIGPDLLALASGCAQEGEGLCVAGSKSGKLDAELEAGVEVAVLVDASSIARRGAFALKVESLCETLECGERECGAWGCGDCGQCADDAMCTQDGACVPEPKGDHCDDPYEIDSVPALVTGDTNDYTSDYYYKAGHCSNTANGYGKASSDVVYRFTPPAVGTYTFRLDATHDAILFLRQECDAVGACLQGIRNKGGGEELAVELDSVEPVFVFVDGASNSSNWRGKYTLRIDTCVPQCSDANPCGDDGCGHSCGPCDEGFRCHAKPSCEPIPKICVPTSTCDEIPQGDLCSDPLPIESLPFAHTATSAGFDPDYSYGSGVCSGESGSWGGSKDDVAFGLTAPVDGLYEFRLKASADSSVFVVSDCEDIGATCIGAKKVKGKKGYKSLYRELQAGEDVHAIVDGGSTFTLKVSLCTPSCNAKICGSDGCGGSCGSCGAGETCSAGGCIVLPGYTCEAALAVGTLPWEHESKTNSYGTMLSDACSDPLVGDASKEVVYRFTAPADGHYSAIVTAKFNATVYALTDCAAPAETCLPNAMEGVPLVQTTFEAASGEEIIIVVDGNDAGGGGNSGSYVLRVEEACFPECEGQTCGDDGCGRPCGTCTYPEDVCDPGGVCRAPADAAGMSFQGALDVGDLPFVGDGDTTEAADHFYAQEGECPGYVTKGRYSFDQVWRLVSVADGTYRVTVQPDGFDAWLSVKQVSEDGMTTCVAGSDTQGEETVLLSLAAGSEAFIIVDGASNKQNDAGPYMILVEALE